MPTAVIVDAIRTPLGRRNGKLKDWHPVDLAAETLKALIDRTGIDPGIVDDVVVGCVMQVGEQAANVARNAVLAAGWPETVPGTTIDRQCGSSQQAAHFAAQGVIAGAYDVVVAAGVESMSRVPMGTSATVGGTPFGPKGWPPMPTLVPIGTRLIDSTPAATTMSYAPAITPCAAKCSACWLEPHWRSTLVPTTVSGNPAARAAFRAMLMLCSPTWLTQPMITSSTRAGSSFARSTSAVSVLAARSTAWIG